VRQPIEEMCCRAVQLILDLIDGQIISDDGMLIQITPELIVRESTGPVPADWREKARFLQDVCAKPKKLADKNSGSGDLFRALKQPKKELWHSPKVLL
jgi:hypothetical protein